MVHECKQEEEMGKIKEFMSNLKGVNAMLFSLTIAIIVQVGTFLYLWGGLTEVVKKNTEYLWANVAPCTTENTRNIDKILTKLDMLEIFKIQKEIK